MEPQDKYASQDASPPPGSCDCCGDVKDDGSIVTVNRCAYWVCHDCQYDEARFNAWVGRMNE